MGSRVGRAGNMGRAASCAQNGKWITSLAAMLHLIRATLVRDVSVLVAPVRPAMSFAFLYLFVPSTLAFTKVLCFVLPDLLNVLLRPPPVFTAIHANLF